MLGWIQSVCTALDLRAPDGTGVLLVVGTATGELVFFRNEMVRVYACGEGVCAVVAIQGLAAFIHSCAQRWEREPLTSQALDS